jgi:LysM repeat protein
MENTAPPARRENRSQTIHWRYGDAPASVARAHGVTPDALRAANPGVDFGLLPPGAPICVPPRLTCPNGALYAARPGDSFASIARAFGVRPGALADQNPYVDPTALAAGQILCVPPGAPEISSP